jgi:hypothetical protein
MDQKEKNIKFAHFLEKFPEIDMPITLGEETHHHFSRDNDPLPALMISRYILPLEEDLDELTEFVPCFRIMGTDLFHAVVYWRAGLMNYQYILTTFTEKGLLIDKHVIAGTFSDGKVLTQSVATIDEDWIISIASGQSELESTEYTAASSTAYQLELLPDGKIVRST